MSKKLLGLVLINSLILSGCGLFEEEAKRIKEEKPDQVTEDSKLKEEQMAEIYEQMARPAEEVIYETNLDSLKEINTINVETKNEYKDAEEFSRYVSKTLFEFHTSKLNPEGYYNFLVTHGSQSVKEELPTKEEALSLLTTLQEMFVEQNYTATDYKITEIIYAHLEQEGTFYRKVNTSTGEQFYACTITLEDGNWKYVEDGPAPPYIVNGKNK